MKLIKTVVAITLINLLFNCTVFPLDFVDDDFTVLNLGTYFGSSDNVFKLEWTIVTNAEEYEVRGLHVETDEYVMFGRTSNNFLTLTLPRAGHFILEVRSISGDVVSEWVESTNPDKSWFNEGNQGWWIYTIVDPPGELSIE